MERDRPRVVVTGMGAITPLGQTPEMFWDNLVAGRSGIGPMTLCDPTDYPCRISGEVSDFDPVQYIDQREARRMARFSQLAVAAGLTAVESARLDVSKMDTFRAGVVLGNGNGGFPTLEENCRILAARGGMRMTPFFFPMVLPNIGRRQRQPFHRGQGIQFHRHHRLRRFKPGYRRSIGRHPAGGSRRDARRRFGGRNQPIGPGRVRSDAGPEHPK